MTLLRLAYAPLLALLLAAPAHAEKIPLAEISKYINSLQTAVADFTQVNADGSVTKGKVFIKRPGRVRFEYAPPDKTLVMAGEGQVAVFDPKSNQPPEQYPLSRTPLSLILAKDVDLGRAKMVRAHKEEEATTVVVAQDPAHPEYGTIEMVFTGGPVALRQWVITDDAGGKTTVILGDLEKGGVMASSLFSIQSEIAKRK